MLFGASSTRAQTTGIAADRFAPGVGPGVILGVEAGEVTARGQVAWSSSLGGLADPIRLEGRYTGTVVSYPVEHALTSDLSLEVGVARRFALGIAMPITWWQNGDRLRGTGTDEGPLGSPRGGDLRFRAKVAFVGDPNAPGLHAALLLVVTAPTGGQADFAGTPGATVAGRVIVDYRSRYLAVAADLGARFAKERQLFQTRLGDEFLWGLGIVTRPLGLGRMLSRLVVEAAGAVGTDAGTRPVELRGALRLGTMAFDVDLGGGAGLVNDLGSPSWRVFAIARGLIGRAR
jgi:hypothetical protein